MSESTARMVRSIDVSAAAPAGAKQLAVTIVGADDAPVVLVCVPGGGMSAHYFDLHVDGADTTYSMTDYLAAAGCVVVLLDHLGVGGSDVPDDPYALSPEVLADVNAHAVDQLRGDWPDAVVVGVGHSMGAMLTVVQQARHGTYDALALLGYSGRGLPEQLLPQELAASHDPEMIRDQLGALTKARFGHALVHSETSTSEYLNGPDVAPEVAAALRGSAAPMLGLAGLASMIPGGHAAEVAAIDVPVFLGLAANDIAGPTHEVPAYFTASRDVTLYVQPDAYHNSNAAPTRLELWDRLARWAGDLK